MKRIKSRIPSICAAVLMVGCLCATTAFAAAPTPLPSVEESIVVEQIPAQYDGDNEVVVLSETISDTDGAATDTTAPTEEQTDPAETAEEESGGFFDWYVGLFSNNAFVIVFVAIIAVVALLLMKMKSGGSRSRGKAKSNSKSNRKDGL